MNRATRRNIGRTLSTIRALAGLTQDSVAKSAGMSRSNLANIEVGTHDLTFDAFLRLSRALKQKPDALARALLGSLEDAPK